MVKKTKLLISTIKKPTKAKNTIVFQLLWVQNKMV